jgi:hypothetical protein
MSPLARALLAELDEDALAELAARLAPYLPQPAAAQDDGWLDSAAAARYLGISRAALHRYSAAKTIPCEQDCSGGKLWFKRSQLDAWRREGARA